ncbi:MAG: hypothetical protein IAG13_03100 [Deltaproteobacteria bacterium]|nr:hypothetical protein [Nannocystaceae bacterium]
MQDRNVPPPQHTRKLASAFATSIALCSAPACFIHVSPLDEDGESDGTTGDDPQPDGACIYTQDCNGVYAYCQNNGGGAVDDSGGDDGAAPNYWWVAYDAEDHGPLPNPFAICVPGVGDVADVCCNAGCDVTQLGNNCCYAKQDDEPGNVVPTLSKTVRVCLGLGTPVADLDPLSDWVGGSYPGFEDGIRARCSTRCSQLSQDPVGLGVDNPPLCEDDNWSGIATRPSWEPDQGENCLVGLELNDDDPDGSDIPWHLVGGATTPVPLDCDLNGDCVDWFVPTLAPFVLTPGAGTFIEPETRGAHYLAVEGTGSSVAIDVDMPGSAAGIDDSEPMFGLAEYTASDCGDTVCPFFLANLIAYNSFTSWELQLQPDIGGKIKKHVSDVQIDLMQSTLGVLHTGLGKVAFAPGALQLRVQLDLSANGGSTYGDGTHATFIENVAYAFADYDDGALTLTHAFPVQNGFGTLTLDVVPDEYPPVAIHDLMSTEACDTPGGLTLDGTHDLSTDPDNDIASADWFIDGSRCGETCLLPAGSHRVALEVRDERGAVHRTTEQWTYVTTSCT